MTVKELKEYLNRFDENLEVEFWSEYSERYEPLNEWTIKYEEHWDRIIIE